MFVCVCVCVFTCIYNIFIIDIIIYKIYNIIYITDVIIYWAYSRPTLCSTIKHCPLL